MQILTLVSFLVVHKDSLRMYMINLTITKLIKIVEKKNFLLMAILSQWINFWFWNQNQSDTIIINSIIN